MPTERERADELAWQVVRNRNLGIALLPSQSMLLAQEYLRVRGMLPIEDTTIPDNVHVSSNG